MLETLKQIAECLRDYIGLAKAIILSLIAVIAFLKKVNVRTIYVRVLQFLKKIQIVGQPRYIVRQRLTCVMPLN